MTPLNVAIGTTSLIRPLTGIGQYTLHLTAELSRDPAFRLHYFYGYAWSDVAAPREVPHLPAIKRWVKRLHPKPYEFGRFLQKRRFDRGIRTRKPELYHEPNYMSFRFDGPTILSIHDLSYLRYPETHPALRIRVMHKLLPPAIERAAHLLTDSETTRREVIAEYGVPEDKVTATLLGVDARFRPRDEAACAPVLQRYGLAYQHYVLAVGTLEPRKNLLLAIRAQAALDPATARAWPLVFVGMRGWKSAETERAMDRLIADGRAVRLGFVPDEDLPVLYSGARLVVYPSLYEGFGLPAAEAMASGVPLVTSDRSCLPEVTGPAGVAVDPDDVQGLRDAVRRFHEDDDHRARHVALGLARARELTWARCAASVAKVYLRTAGRA